MSSEIASQLMPVVEAALSISRNSEAMDVLTRVANDPGSVASSSNSSSTQSVVLDVLYQALQQNKQRGLCYKCKQEVQELPVPSSPLQPISAPQLVQNGRRSASRSSRRLRGPSRGRASVKHHTSTRGRGV